MAIKMRVLYASNKGKIAEMAQMIKAAYDLPVNAVDKIPTAYSCNNERVVVLMFSLKGEPEDQVRLFCQELTRARAQNVAIVMDGPESAAQRMKEILVAAGTNVFDEIHYVKTAKLSFLDKIKPEEKADLLAFVERVVANLQ
ncbi:MAG: hypothetical protein IJC99_05215 [Clostridia bacterium]|nr:hypothetical protein [Clostridia bacterium]